MNRVRASVCGCWRPCCGTSGSVRSASRPILTSISSRSTARAPSPRSKSWNAATLRALEKQPGFADYRAKALALLSTNQKIAEPDQILGDKVLNFWQDEQHPRGIWRVSPLAAFASGQPQWRTLLDIDAMSKADNKKWVFKGADLPFARLCRLHGQPVERRRRRRRGARVRPRQGGLHSRRLLPSEREERSVMGEVPTRCSSAPTLAPERSPIPAMRES